MLGGEWLWGIGGGGGPRGGEGGGEGGGGLPGVVPGLDAPYAGRIASSCWRGPCGCATP